MRTLAIAAVLTLGISCAHADDTCTPQANWQTVKPGQTITLRCGDETVVRYPTFAHAGYGGHPGNEPFVIGWEDTVEDAARENIR